MPDTAIAKPKVVMYGLVRDKDGRPKIDDPENLPPPIAEMLTPEERAEFGVKDNANTIDSRP